MKPFFLTLALLSATPALAADSDVIALWAEDSGSLPPEYAWGYKVEIQNDGLVRATYCKGYAEEPPGCATVEKQMTDDQMDAFEEAVTARMDDLLAHPPKPVPLDEMQVGGGSTGGWIILSGQKITLPPEVVKGDVERTQGMLRVLQEATPKNLVKKAERRAKQP